MSANIDNLRVCGGCSAWLLTSDATTPTILCGKCRANLTPFRQWATGLTPGDRVFVQPGCGWRGVTRSQYVILERDGDMLKVQLIGVPESRITVSVNDCAQRERFLNHVRHAVSMLRCSATA